VCIAKLATEFKAETIVLVLLFLASEFLLHDGREGGVADPSRRHDVIEFRW
jgi:hypothetical protein